MSEITDWEPLATGSPVTVEQYISTLQPPTDDSDPQTYWQRQYGKGLEHIENLLCEIENLKEQLATSQSFASEKNAESVEHIIKFHEIKKKSDELSQKNTALTRDIKELQGKFTCFKADAITTLKAIDLCIIASLCTQKQWLTHKARNFRMRHVHQIICNEVASLGDRQLITYEDDF